MSARRAPGPEGPRPVEGAPPLDVLRRGLQATPELRQGVGFTAALAVAAAAGKLAVPVLVQQTLDRGVLGPEGFRPAFVCGWRLVIRTCGAVFRALRCWCRKR